MPWRTAAPPHILVPRAPSSAHPSPTRTSAQEKPYRPENAGPPPCTRRPCGRWSRACKGRAGWSVDGEGEKAAQRGQAGGVGGVQGHPAGRTSKQDTFCTSPDTCTHTPMRLAKVRSPLPTPSVRTGQGRHHHRVQNTPIRQLRAARAMEEDCMQSFAAQRTE